MVSLEIHDLSASSSEPRTFNDMQTENLPLQFAQKMCNTPCFDLEYIKSNYVNDVNIPEWIPIADLKSKSRLVNGYACIM